MAEEEFVFKRTPQKNKPSSVRSPPSSLAANVFTNKDSPNLSVHESIHNAPSRPDKSAANSVQVSMYSENNNSQFFNHDSNNSSNNLSQIMAFEENLENNFPNDINNGINNQVQNVDLEEIFRNQLRQQQRALELSKFLTFFIEICLICAIAVSIVGVVLATDYLMFIPMACSLACLIFLRIMTLPMFLVAFSCIIVIFVEGIYFTVLVVMILITNTFNYYTIEKRLGFILDCSHLLFGALELLCVLLLRKTFIKIQSITNPHAPPMGTSVPMIFALKRHSASESESEEKNINDNSDNNSSSCNANIKLMPESTNNVKNKAQNFVGEKKKTKLEQQKPNKKGGKEINSPPIATEVDVLQLKDINYILVNEHDGIGVLDSSVPLDNVVLDNGNIFQRNQLCPRDKRKGVLHTPNYDGTHRGSHRTLMLPEALSDKYIVDSKKMLSPVGSVFMHSPSDRVTTIYLQNEDSPSESEPQNEEPRKRIL